jgi:hypothetical protein
MFTFPITLFGKPPGGGGATTTWNPADKAAGVTLTGGNLHAATSGAGGDNVARSTVSKTTGKAYLESLFVTINGQDLIGLANSTHSLTAFIGSDLNSFGIVGSSGQIYINGGSSVTGPTVISNQVMGIAIDFGTSKAWFRNATTAPTVWNAGGGADPVTGSGGFDFSTITGPFFAAVCLDSTSSETANFGQNAFSATPPTGYSAWG